MVSLHKGVNYPESVRGVDPVATRDVDGGERGTPGTGEGASTIEPHEPGGRLLLMPSPDHEGLVDTVATVCTDHVVCSRPIPDWSSPDPYGLGAAIRDAPPVDGALLVGPRDQPLNTLLPGPVVAGTPVGIIRPMDSGHPSLPFGPAAATWAVLAMGKADYLDPAAALHAHLAAAEKTTDAALTVRDWRATAVSRPHVCEKLAIGPALAVYLGHGRPTGWSGYQAVRWRHVQSVPGVRPIGALLCLSCDTLATPRDGGPPFGERFVLAGRAEAVLGAVSDVRIEDLETLASTIGEALIGDDSVTIGELLVTVQELLADQGEAEILDPYRLVGLPTRAIR